MKPGGTYRCGDTLTEFAITLWRPRNAPHLYVVGYEQDINVTTAKSLCANDPRSHWWAFGTARTEADAGRGALHGRIK